MTFPLGSQIVSSLLEGGRMMMMRGDPARLPTSSMLVVTLFAVGVSLGTLARLLIPPVELSHALMNAGGEYALLLLGARVAGYYLEREEALPTLYVALLAIALIGDFTFGLLRAIGNADLYFLVGSGMIGLVLLGQAFAIASALSRPIAVAGLVLLLTFIVTLGWFDITAELARRDAEIEMLSVL